MNLIVKYNIYLIYKTLKLWLVNVSVVVKRVVKALVRRVSNYYSVKLKLVFYERENINTLGEYNKLEGCSSDITPLFLYQ